MNINLTGHQVEITEALRQFVNDKFEKINRHFDRITKISVVLEIEKLFQVAEATIHVPGGDIHAKAEAEDLYSAIDLLIDKLERQLKKHKDKLYNH